MDYSAGRACLSCRPSAQCAGAHPQAAAPYPVFDFSKDFPMSLSLSIGPLVSLIAGILILVMPRLLSTIVALYLIIMGILGLLGMHTLRF
ncbi:hypothetical protein ACINB_34650 [Acidovorax sp. NB1]|nr:hypothetical protein ACINB_34650 [Acidovorax sp. NB1]